MFKISNLFPFNKIAVAKNKRISAAQQEQKFNVSMQPQPPEDTFVKSKNTTAPQNSVVAETFDNSKDTTYNENKDVNSSNTCKKVGFKMEEFITDKELQERLLKIAYQDIEEPEYQSNSKEYDESDEDMIHPTINYFDSNGILRKKEFYTRDSITEVLIYNEHGSEQKQIRIFLWNLKRPSQEEANC